MRSVNLIGDCHSTRIWEHWNPEDCPVDFKVWGVAGMTAWAFDPKKLEEEKAESSGIESGSDYCVKQRDYWVRPFNEFKDSDIVMLWLGYVDIRQWLPKHQNTEQTVIEYLDRVREYFKGSTIQLIEPLPQFTEMLLKYDGISPSYTYEERRKINGIFISTLNKYVRDHNMLKPITQLEIREAVGLSEFTPEDTATWAPHPQDSLKREYWSKIYDLFIKKASLIKTVQFSLISPPGCGNTFAENLLHEYVEDSRYESIASCIELDLSKNSSSLNYLENARFMNQIKFDRFILDDMFERCIKDYRYFLNQLNKEESSHALLCTFEFLTKTPENFLNKFSNKFNAKLKDFDSNLIQEIIINKMKNDKFAEKRIPKKINPLRSLINNRIREYEPMKELFLEYKKQIEKENING